MQMEVNASKTSAIILHTLMLSHLLIDFIVSSSALAEKSCFDSILFLASW